MPSTGQARRAPAARRQLPTLDAGNSAFWTSGAEGRLKICRCGDCGLYIHPPLPCCPACNSEAVAPVAVSGRGRVASYTVNRQAWVPGMTVPFIFAAVELEEQAELYVFTNIVDCAIEDVRLGLPVEVVFEQDEDVFLPMFRPREGNDVR